VGGADRRRPGIGESLALAQGDLSFWPVWVAGAVRAALGDWLSYWIGTKLGPVVGHLWPLWLLIGAAMDSTATRLALERIAVDLEITFRLGGETRR
jgi:hypothetical protein